MRWATVIETAGVVCVCAAFSLASDAVRTNVQDVSMRAEAEFNVVQGLVTKLEVDGRAGVTQQITLPIEGELIVVEVSPYSMRANNYRIRHQIEDGSLIEVPPGDVRTVRGFIHETGGHVIGSVTEAGLTAMVEFPDGRTYYVEPIRDRVEGAQAGEHLIYRKEDIIPHGRSCGAAFANLPLVPEAGPSPEFEGAGCVGLPCLTEVGVDTDREFFQIWGAGTESRINTLFNLLSLQYELQVGIVYQITDIIVRTAEPDPYTTNACSDLLGEFADEWQANQQDVPRDVAHLFTGKGLSGCAGIAFSCTFQSLGCGQICGTQLGYSLVPSFPNAFEAAGTSAHELGHNWGAQHCGPILAICDADSFPPGSCNPCGTMRCSAPISREFSVACTVPQISAHRDNRLCLDSLAPFISFPFEDTFEGVLGDPPSTDSWFSEAAIIDNQGAGEPSGQHSMRITGMSRATSGVSDTSSVPYVGLEYWWQRTGDSGGSPEPGEDMSVQYVNADRVWAELDVHPGGGSDNLPFERACQIITDPDVDALQIRFSMEAGQPSSDNFYVDDVRIVDGRDLLRFDALPESDCACTTDGTAEFSALGAGEDTISYQWRFEGQNLAGETGPTLSLTNLGAGDFGFYSVAISNACGSLESAGAALLEAGALTIGAQPQDTEVAPGGTLAFFMSVGGGCPDFQWFRNGEPIQDATSSFLFLPNMQCEDQGCYDATISNDCGEIQTDIAIVTVTGCPPVNCVVDAPPEIVHAEGLPGQTRPLSGYIDPRRESDNGVDLNRGITSIAIEFSETVQAVGGGALAAGSFMISETGANTPPAITGVDESGMPLIVLSLDRPITVGEWTTIQAVVQDVTGQLIVSSGNLGPDTDEPDRVDVAFLPADTDQDGAIGPFDLLRFRQIVNDQVNPNVGLETDYVDIDRDGAIGPFDLLAFRQLVNGISPATQAWSGASLDNPRP